MSRESGTGSAHPVAQTVERVLTPFENFIKDQSASSAVLVACTIIALVWANSPAHETYTSIFQTPLTIAASDWSLSLSVRGWISEGLMAFFFYLLGMEIKREFLAGELSDWRRAVPVGVAAGGGMLAPALLYLAATWPAPELTRGWGIPMATDAAFAIGLLTLMRKRIPASLITFVTALAIIDDLGAIVVIALFYSEHLHATYLGWAGGGVAVLLMANVLGVRSPYIYLLGGVCIWYALHHSGIHPTIAGILVAVTVPARPARDPDWFIARVRALIRHFEGRARNQGDMLEEDTQHELAENVADSARKATTPLQRWENFIEHPVYFVVMPSFALANAGIRIDSATLQAWADSPLSVGIGAGLIGGKVLGIAGATWLAVRLGVGEWPRDAGFRHVVGVALLAGIGFTMSIFIAGLTFPESSAEYDVAMISILLTSLIAALAGLVWLRWFSGER